METERRIAHVELLLRSVNVLGYAGILSLLVYYVMDGTGLRRRVCFCILLG